MKNIQSFSDISKELVHMGTLANKPLEAELMNIFIDAAIAAIDNQQAVLLHHFKERQVDLPRVLVVNFHQTFTVPTTKTLTGQILTRMQALDITLKYVSESGQAHEWMAPIDRERLVNLNPDYLIIATENEEEAAKDIYGDKALNEISALRHHRLLFVDESIQHSPSQYAVLAYHDLVQALASQQKSKS
jgi:iron complex transport system substrate-binding protein